MFAQLQTSQSIIQAVHAEFAILSPTELCSHTRTQYRHMQQPMHKLRKTSSLAVIIIYVISILYLLWVFTLPLRNTLLLWWLAEQWRWADWLQKSTQKIHRSVKRSYTVFKAFWYKKKRGWRFHKLFLAVSVLLSDSHSKKKKTV